MEENTTPSKPVRIGRIYATIAGDYRYGTTIEVVLVDGGAEVRLVSDNPVGGMDGPGGTYSSQEVLHRWDAPPTAKDLVAVLKKQFAKADGGTVARYGKPTKNFTWYYANGVTTKGMSQALAARALAER